MAMHEPDRLAELLCSRLCHDLISPLGAITNGVELVSEGDRSMFDDALALIGASARQGTARLSYFRLAFGAGGAEADFGFAALRKVISDHFEDRKVPVTWVEPAPGGETRIARPIGKLILNLMLVAGECAQRNGAISATLSMDGPRPRLAIGVRGGRCKLRDDVRTGFAPDIATEALTVRNIVAWQCRQLAEGLGLQLAVVEDGQTSVEFTAA